MQSSMKFDKYLKISILLMILINLVDLLITIYLIDNGLGYEGNPIARYLFNYGYVFAFSVNIFFITLINLFSFKLGELSIKHLEKKEYTKKVRKKHFKVIIITFYVLETLVILNNINIIWI